MPHSCSFCVNRNSKLCYLIFNLKCGLIERFRNLWLVILLVKVYCYILTVQCTCPNSFCAIYLHVNISRYHFLSASGCTTTSAKDVHLISMLWVKFTINRETPVRTGSTNSRNVLPNILCITQACKYRLNNCSYGVCIKCIRSLTVTGLHPHCSNIVLIFWKHKCEAFKKVDKQLLI